MGFYSGNGGRIGVGPISTKTGIFDLDASRLIGDFLFEFDEFTFTNAGKTGISGPSYAQLQTEYAGTDWISNTEYFNVSNGIQLWTVPTTATYRITAAGAQGGNGSNNLGAVIAGDFDIEKGQKIQILVGQEGQFSGGGGGSFVVKEGGTQNEDIYVIAGGGGGKSGTGGTATTFNASNTVSDGNGGLANNGSYSGPAGGGFFTSGVRSTGSNNRDPGFGFLQGGTGGDAGYGDGGFGGGGAGGADSIAGGGCGGGYSGGTGKGDGSNGDGAGSYPNGQNQSNTANANSGHGYVTITRI